MNDRPTARDQLYQLIQSQAGDSEFTGAPEDAVLTGFLVIVEWESPNGDRWISKNSGDHARNLPSWRERGLAAEVVHGFWGSDGDEDDE